jgi:hypothetical protein
MKLIDVILKAYERWQDRRRYGKLEPLDHYCIHRVMENGDKISYITSHGRPNEYKNRGTRARNERRTDLLDWRRSGNFLFTVEKKTALQAVEKLGQEVTGLSCIVRKLHDLKSVLAALPAEAQSTKGGSVVLHTSSGPQKLIHVALSSDVPVDQQTQGPLTSRVRILTWPSSRDLLCLYSRPSVGGDVGQVTQAVLGHLQTKMPTSTLRGTGRAISVIKEIVEGKGLRTPQQV